jgi:hypothetical protein
MLDYARQHGMLVDGTYMDAGAWSLTQRSRTTEKMALFGMILVSAAWFAIGSVDRRDIFGTCAR